MRRVAMRSAIRPIVALLAAALAPPTGTAPCAEDPEPPPGAAVGWRGDGNGRYPAAEPATRWEAEEGVLWKCEIGAGHSSPILVGRRVLVASEPDILACVESDTGRELWRKTHGLADVSREAAAKGAAHSSQYGDAIPTPVSDGRRVWMVFGTGLVSCHDLEGTRSWMAWYDLRRTTGYGRTSSPVLIGERLLVHLGPLVCLEAATGKVLWTNDDARASYGTPAATRIGGVDVLVTPKGDVVRVEDGKILASDLGNCTYTSPVVEDGVAYFIDGTMTAVRLPEKAAEAIEPKELWTGELGGEVFASPLAHRGRIYTADKAGTFYAIDAGTGKVLLEKPLDLRAATDSGEPSVYSSLCLAGKVIVLCDDAGRSVVLEPGDAGAVAGAGSLPAGSGATPTFGGRRMFARGGPFLYCVGTR